MRRGGVLKNDFAVGSNRLIVIGLFESCLARFGELQRADITRLGLIGVAKPNQDIVHVAVLRIGGDDGLVARDDGRVVVMSRVKRGDLRLPSGHDLLHLAQALFCLRHKGRFGELLQHQAVFFFRVDGLGVVAVGFVHLAEIDVTDPHLGLGGLGCVGKEGNEVLVLLFGLGESCGAALFVPAIGDGQLGFHLVLRVGISVEQRLQVETGDVEVAAFGGVDCLVVENFVGQASVNRSDLLLFPQLLLGILGLNAFVILLLAGRGGEGAVGLVLAVGIGCSGGRAGYLGVRGGSED